MLSLVDVPKDCSSSPKNELAFLLFPLLSSLDEQLLIVTVRPVVVTASLIGAFSLDIANLTELLPVC